MQYAPLSYALLPARPGLDAERSASPNGAVVWRSKTAALSAALLTLGACAAPVEPAAVEPPDLTERLAAIAAPYQDVQTARLRPEDGCYWYSHVGPVETTMLPLRTVDGRPICMPRYDPMSVAG